MTVRHPGQAPSRLVAVLGPTNTGKTHLAVERMLGHASGMIGLPLRLLAREIYDRIVAARGARAVALITGEEKIVPPRAHYFVCTVEAMPLNREVEFLAVDEIQLAADPERGHVFTHRLLHARGRYETMLMGSGTMAPLIRRLLPEAEIVTRERFSTLTYAGARKLTRLPRRSAVVAFSADEVYAIAELIRRQRGGAAVVMGSLSPRTRNAQVALYQSGEVDFLVATDAIGMGLNMDVDHVAFAGLRKFDGRRTRWLHPHEVGQIAGRAGRYRTDGTFGVTGTCEEMDDDLVERVESHHFEPVTAAEWRNARLDFQSLAALLRSLDTPPPREGLKASEEALDETTLRQLAADDEVIARCRDRSALFRLWDACQTPDFRKTTQDDHARLVRTLFDHLTQGRGRVPDEWMSGQFRFLDRTDGEIDALSTRLAGVRTLAYVANRPDWLGDPAHWQGVTRALEDRLSDTLHEKLMARFIDRRTSALMRGLGQGEELLAGVGADGVVTVEGHFVGRLRGLAFDMARGSGALEEKALRAAAQRAVGPEIARRLGRLAADGDDAFKLTPEGEVLWRGEAAGELAGDRPFSPQVRLYGELGPEPARARAARRLEAFVAAEAQERLPGLKRLEDALAGGSLKGLPRGLAWRLVEAGGVLARTEIETDVKSLSQSERRALRSLGVRIGAFSLHLPGLLEEASRAFARAFALQAAGEWRPTGDEPQRLVEPAPPARALGLLGLARLGAYAVPVAQLERLDELLRGAMRQGEAALFSDQAREELGWSEADARGILKALGYATVGRPAPGEPTAWRRRPEKPATRGKAPRPNPASPFAALAVLTQRPAPKGARRRPRRKPATARKPAHG
ncbi:MAG TPA: helicase-related protein [Caulobacteraceae bacterium]|nr:helicase-related protein [Caulobacteraceae bacterium]